MIIENFSFINEHLKYNYIAIIYILEGIKVLNHLREFRLYDKTEYFEEINEEIFYKYFPEYIEHSPFLNNIKFIYLILIKMIYFLKEKRQKINLMILLYKIINILKHQEQKMLLEHIYVKMIKLLKLLIENLKKVELKKHMNVLIMKNIVLKNLKII